LCHVCAASPGDLATVLAALGRKPEILSLNPQSLSDVWNDIQTIGTAIGKADRARELVTQLEGRVAAMAQASSRSSIRPRVACIEWLDPLFVAGHWVPEMVESAGGTDILGKAGRSSYRTTWEDVLNANPEIIVIMPCGYNLEGALKEFNALTLPDGWESLTAVRDGNVFAVDASGYFSRPGPRLAGGVEILAGMLQPEIALTPPPASCTKVAPLTRLPRN
jgi:iron complex transport system substrate-binding protein